jgi:hypothetical protein
MPRSGTTEHLSLNLLDLVSDSHPGWAVGIQPEAVVLTQMPIEGRMKLTVPDSLRIQWVDATASANASDGDIKPSVLRGLLFSERAMALSCC